MQTRFLHASDAPVDYEEFDTRGKINAFKREDDDDGIITAHSATLPPSLPPLSTPVPYQALMAWCALDTAGSRLKAETAATASAGDCTG